jgi:O-acetyl-ADP-ribose deacetylase (regulator of RNase III)
MEKRIELVVGDITVLEVDAIVNAANNTLMGGGGVDGAIHSAAGPKLVEECELFNGCPTGDAKITKGYNLRAHHVIHTVGPVWYGGNKNEENLLASCYQRCLQVAVENGVKTIVFPGISTGVYRFPKDRAAKIAVTEVGNFLQVNPELEKVIFVCFDQAAFNIYNAILITDGKR